MYIVGKWSRVVANEGLISGDAVHDRRLYMRVDSISQLAHKQHNARQNNQNETCESLELDSYHQIALLKAKPLVAAQNRFL